MEKQLTNELGTADLAGLNRFPFTLRELAVMTDEARAIIGAQDEYHRLHPVNAIWRYATTGSLTRNGGRVSSASSGVYVVAEDKSMTGIALIGDTVTYHDGSTARIISGCARVVSPEGRGFAIVGSLLDNGDEIISTSQHVAFVCCRK